MRRSSFLLLKQGLPSAVVRSKPVLFGQRKTGFVESSYRLCPAGFFSSSVGGGGVRLGKVNGDKDNITLSEVKKIMRLVNVGALKMKLATGGKETICYSELLEACGSMGVTKSDEEARKLVKALEEAGVVLIFREKVYLHPDQVVEEVIRAAPLALKTEEESWREEMRTLQAKLEKIDILAYKKVRRMFWIGLGIVDVLVGMTFRLTFWEFTWDVMGPIVFFTTTTSGVLISYSYFLFTSRDPSYQDLLTRLFLSRRRKLIKKHNFDMDRFMELNKKCKSSFFVF